MRRDLTQGYSPLKMMGVLVVPFRGLNLWIGTAYLLLLNWYLLGVEMNWHTPIKQDSGTWCSRNFPMSTPITFIGEYPPFHRGILLIKKTFFSFISLIFLTLVIKTFADNWLPTSFFPSYRFGVAVEGHSIVLETYPSPRR